MAETTLHDMVHDDLKARREWEDRQGVWYKMRHNGLKRARKPYAGAPDMHFPLADTVLDKLKPFYYRQMFAAELLANLTAQRSQNQEWTGHAERWFDHELKSATNLYDEIHFVIDAMLLAGTGILRPFWNARRSRIQFDAIDPLNFIVPPGTNELQEAGRMTHVECITVEEYKRRTAYNQDDEFLKLIAGRGENQTQKSRERELREGLNGTADKDKVVIWNVWEGEPGKWLLRTLSPYGEDLEIMKPLRNPFRHGLAPFVDFPREKKEKGFYSSRGEVEKIAQFERYLSKLWNKKIEALDFFATPLLTSDDPNVEGKNIRFSPGEFVGKGIKRVDWGSPPIALDQEMMSVRSIAEQRVGTPDFGIGGSQNGKDPRTATEIDQLANLGGITTELRAHIFRGSLQKALQMAWSLAVQYRGRSLDYLYDDAPQQMPQPALHEKYAVSVGGSVESWNRQLELQKAQALAREAKGDSYYDQLEVRKVFVETLNPRWVKRLVRDPQQQANTEQQEEMIRVPALMEGFPLQPEPHENHPVRLEVIFRKLQQLGQSGQPVDPVAQQNIVRYFNARLELWKQQDSKAANAWMKQRQQEMKAAQQQRQQSGNMLPFPGPAGAPAAAAPAVMMGGAQ